MKNHFNVALGEPVNPAAVSYSACGDWSPYTSPSSFAGDDDEEDDDDDEDEDWDDDDDDLDSEDDDVEPVNENTNK